MAMKSQRYMKETTETIFGIFGLAQDLSSPMKVEGLLIYSATSHQGLTEIFWIHTDTSGNTNLLIIIFIQRNPLKV